MPQNKKIVVTDILLFKFELFIGVLLCLRSTLLVFMIAATRLELYNNHAHK